MGYDDDDDVSLSMMMMMTMMTIPELKVAKLVFGLLGRGGASAEV